MTEVKVRLLAVSARWSSRKRRTSVSRVPSHGQPCRRSRSRPGTRRGSIRERGGRVIAGMIRTMLPRPALAAPIAWTRFTAFAATLALVVLGVAWELWLAPTGRGTLAVKVLPLLLALGGLWRMRLYTYRWMSLVVWLYTGEGLV